MTRLGHVMRRTSLNGGLRLAAWAAVLLLRAVPAGAAEPCLGQDFWAARAYPVGGYATRAIAVGDFNNDGIADLAVANHGSSLS